MLTAKGHRALNEAQQRWREAQDEMRAKLGPERFDRLLVDLRDLMSATV